MLLVGGVLAAFVAGTPLVYLVLRSLERGPGFALEVATQPRTGELALRSIGLTAAVSSACLVLGIVTAWLAVRSDLPGRRWWGVLFALPLAVPSFVAAFAWLAQWQGAASFVGAFGVLTAVSYPYVMLPVAAALRLADPAQEEAARSLGRGPVATFTAVTLRQIRPAALAGALLVALYVLSDFGAVALLRVDTFTLGIFTSYRAAFDRTPAAVLGCLLVLIALVVTWGESKARGRAVVRTGPGAQRVAHTVPLRRWRPVALLGAVLITGVALGIPLAGVTRSVLLGRSSVNVVELAAATASTAGIAALAAVATTALAIPVGILAARHRGRLVAGVELAAYAGHALPGVTVGLALVFVGIRLFPGLYQELPLLIIAYTVLFLPLAIGTVRTAVGAAPRGLEEVAGSLGASRLATLFRVTLPQAAPGVVAGSALVFLICAKELPATLMLRPTDTDTLATELWRFSSVGAYAEAGPYAAMLIVVAALPTLMLDKVLRRGARP